MKQVKTSHNPSLNLGNVSVSDYSHVYAFVFFASYNTHNICGGACAIKRWKINQYVVDIYCAYSSHWIPRLQLHK